MGKNRGQHKPRYRDSRLKMMKTLHQVQGAINTSVLLRPHLLNWRVQTPLLANNIP
jgi:hypothetical protein